jgi:hypothetical protein
MSTVTVAWLAVLITPAESLGVFVGLAVASYTLPGISPTSGNSFDGYSCCGLDHPRTVDVIHDAFDPLPDHIETDA